jgi:hypothetical protein
MSLTDPSGTVLAFLNEVAGGRTLLRTIRDRVEAGAEHVAIVAPQNQPAAGQIVDAGELRDAALSRVEVTQRILHAFGIESTGAIFDPDSSLALDDAVRAFDPDEILISCLAETRFGWMRKDLVAWASARYRAPVEHIPVRIEDDAVRWDVRHTLVVATRTVDSPDLVERLIERHEESPHRYTFVCPASGDISREEICDKLAATMAALYRSEIDATGQPMSPEPFTAVQNAIAHYRVDEILISTFAGSRSQWLESGLVDRVKEITDKPIEHFEAGGGSRQPETVSVGAGREAE